MSAPLLSCRGVELRYGSRCLVRALDLDVAPGERWALVGPNGAGKSTLLHALAGVRRPDGGRILLGGRTPSETGVADLAALRALVTDRWIDPFAIRPVDSVMAARYRMRLGLRGADRDEPRAEAIAREWLDRMDCAALAGRDIRFLSRGERQRVALAAALAQESALVLLDEPISHQDPRHQRLVLRQLAACAGTTFIGALHDINAAVRFATHGLLLAGDGTWHAGPSVDVLTRARLSALFGTELQEIEVGAHRVFVSACDSPD
jgi:iron complex transport system ATP-binding protein